MTKPTCGKKHMIPYSKIFGRLGNNLFQGAYIYAKMFDGEISDIYVQDPAYFDHHRDEIRKLYGISEETIDYVAIHVRRGDYVGNSFYVDLWETDYYEKAKALFPDEKFMIFSDDIEWVKKHSLHSNYTYDHGDELDSFNRMSACKGIIIANSSYSWWASYLAKEGTKIIAPSVKHWYADGIERTKCPSEWVRI